MRIEKIGEVQVLSKQYKHQQTCRKHECKDTNKAPQDANAQFFLFPPSSEDFLTDVLNAQRNKTKHIKELTPKNSHGL